MKKSIDLVIAILAILTSRSAYVYIDYKHPIQFQNHIIQESCCHVVIEQLKDFDTLSYTTQETQNKDENNKAYMIYTSGTTGTPKGVIIYTHSLCTFVKATLEKLPFHTPQHTVLGTSLSFDATCS